MQGRWLGQVSPQVFKLVVRCRGGVAVKKNRINHIRMVHTMNLLRAERVPMHSEVCEETLKLPSRGYFDACNYVD